MMWIVRLMRRLPTRESRWRSWLPEDTSRGAVDANRSRLAKAVDVADIDEETNGAGRGDAK
jgi:hypothetical protein